MRRGEYSAGKTEQHQLSMGGSGKASGLVIRSVTHSATLPNMSWRPKAFGFLSPTFWYLPSALSKYQAYSPALAGRPQ